LRKPQRGQQPHPRVATHRLRERTLAMGTGAWMAVTRSNAARQSRNAKTCGSIPPHIRITAASKHCAGRSRCSVLGDCSVHLLSIRFDRFRFRLRTLSVTAQFYFYCFLDVFFQSFFCSTDFCIAFAHRIRFRMRKTQRALTSSE
jgi:hypothetical protein